MCFRSILSRQNALNRHMEQKKQKNTENLVFQFFGLLIPYWSPFKIAMIPDSLTSARPSPWRPGPHGAQRRPNGSPKKGPKKEDHIHWWTINEFIDGNPWIFIDGNPLIFIYGVHQWISMDFQFFEIQFFEKTMKKQLKNNEKPWNTIEFLWKKTCDMSKWTRHSKRTDRLSRRRFLW